MNWLHVALYAIAVLAGGAYLGITFLGALSAMEILERQRTRRDRRQQSKGVGHVDIEK